MIIQYYTKSNYGIDHRYPVDPDQLKAIMSISGKKTLTREVIAGLEILGFTFEEVLKPKGIPMANMRDLDRLMA